MRKLSQHEIKEKGQALVEFAFTIIILLVAVTILLDFGRYIYYSSAIKNAAREGARAVVGAGTDFTNIQTIAETAARNTAPAVPITSVTVAQVNYVNEFDDAVLRATVAARYTAITSNGIMPAVQVTVTGLYTAVTPLVQPFISGGSIVITSRAIMPLETAY